MAAEIVKQLLAKPIQLAEQVSKAAEEVYAPFKVECLELKYKTEKLAGLLRHLRQAAWASSDLYERPIWRIIGDTEQVLESALTLVLKCKASNSLMKRVFNIVPAAVFRKMSLNLENSIGNVSWLLSVFAPAEERGGEYLGLPPIATNDPVLVLIWEQVATLHTGSLDERSDAAATLVTLVRDNDRYANLIIEEGGEEVGVGPLLKPIKEGKKAPWVTLDGDNDRYANLIVEEGGVGPLLKLIKEGKKEGQENATRAIGLLGRDAESVEHMVHAGVCSVFANILKEGPLKVQAEVAWAVSELASKYPKCQDLFAQHHIVRLLVSHLAFETVQEHSKYKSIHAVVIASSNNNNNPNNEVKKEKKEEFDEEDEKQVKSRMQHPLADNSQNQMHKVVTSTMAMHASSNKNSNQGNETSQTSQNSSQTQAKQSYSYSGINMKGRELEDPEVKAKMKAMAARALWCLAKGNSSICRSITESRALLRFAILLEKGSRDVKYNSAMAVKEITEMAEKDPELRRSAFKPNSPACKAVVDQVLKIIDEEDTDLLIPCIKAIGSLARTFRATKTRIIGPLVRLLDEREAEVTREATISLMKFACTENYLHIDHSKAIITAGGAGHLVLLVFLGEHTVRVPALFLLSYIALHVPDSEELARAKVLAVLEWASKRPNMTQDEILEALLHESKSRLELYQSRGSRGFQK